jgi:hypothetical protein
MAEFPAHGPEGLVRVLALKPTPAHLVGTERLAPPTDVLVTTVLAVTRQRTHETVVR